MSWRSPPWWLLPRSTVVAFAGDSEKDGNAINAIPIIGPGSAVVFLLLFGLRLLLRDVRTEDDGGGDADADADAADDGERERDGDGDFDFDFDRVADLERLLAPVIVIRFLSLCWFS